MADTPEWIDYPGEWVDYPAEWWPVNPADLPERVDADSQAMESVTLQSRATTAVNLDSMACKAITLTSTIQEPTP